LVAQAHEILGTAAVVRKKYDVAINEYKTAMEGDPTPDATTMVRLAAAYNQAGKPEEALGVIEKMMAMDNVNPQVRPVRRPSVCARFNSATARVRLRRRS
jgi:pentatricopeptide repeat protein